MTQHQAVDGVFSEGETPRCCVRCGNEVTRIHAYGMCDKCYRKVGNNGELDEIKSIWLLQHNHAPDCSKYCHKTHGADGSILCGKCFRPLIGSNAIVGYNTAKDGSKHAYLYCHHCKLSSEYRRLYGASDPLAIFFTHLARQTSRRMSDKREVRRFRHRRVNMTEDQHKLNLERRRAYTATNRESINARNREKTKNKQQERINNGGKIPVQPDGKLIKSIRLSISMSQYELSDLSGISDVMISLIEREKSGSTSDTIKRLAISLGIDDARTLIQWPTDLPEVYK